MKCTSLLLPFLLGIAHACSCDQVGIVEEYRNADVVFSGEVISISSVEIVYNLHGKDRYIPFNMFKFKGNNFWKGSFSDTLIVYSEVDDDACGEDFSLGDPYLLFSFYSTRRIQNDGSENVQEILTTNKCQRNTKIDSTWYYNPLKIELDNIVDLLEIQTGNPGVDVREARMRALEYTISEDLIDRSEFRHVKMTESKSQWIFLIEETICDKCKSDVLLIVNKRDGATKVSYFE